MKIIFIALILIITISCSSTSAMNSVIDNTVSKQNDNTLLYVEPKEISSPLITDVPSEETKVESVQEQFFYPDLEIHTPELSEKTDVNSSSVIPIEAIVISATDDQQELLEETVNVEEDSQMTDSNPEIAFDDNIIMDNLPVVSESYEELKVGNEDVSIPKNIHTEKNQGQSISYTSSETKEKTLLSPSISQTTLKSEMPQSASTSTTDVKGLFDQLAESTLMLFVLLVGAMVLVILLIILLSVWIKKILSGRKNKSTHKKHTSLSEEEITSNLLLKMDCEDYLELFIKHKLMDRKLIAALTKEDFDDLGIMDSNIRSKIVSVVNSDLKKQKTNKQKEE